MSDVAGQRVKRILRPTLETKFHIDYQWWDRADRELDIYMRSHMCPEHQEAFADLESDALVDHVNPDTAEVTRVRGIHHTLITHCARQPDYLSPQSSLVNAVFRVFLANGNQPMSPVELSDRLSRPARTILRTLSGQTVYRGIRPCQED